MTNSAHAYWIINRTGGSITYTWEFKQGVTHPAFWLDAEETRDVRTQLRRMCRPDPIHLVGGSIWI